MAFRGLYEHSLDSKDRLTGSVPVPRGPLRWSCSVQGLRPLRLVAHARGLRRPLRPASSARTAPSAARRAACAAASTAAPSTRSSTPPGGSASPSCCSNTPASTGACVVVGDGEYLEIWDAEAWAKQEEELDAEAPAIAEGLAGPGGRSERAHAHAYAGPPVNRRPSYMPTEHEPVLAAELVELLAPEAGADRRRLHLRRRRPRAAFAERLGPDGTLVRIDRDPSAEARFAEFAADAPCRTRFIGADYAEGLRALRGEGLPQTWSTWTSECPRCRSTPGSGASPTPTTRRSTCGWTPARQFTAADLVNEWPESRIAQALRRFGEERYAGGIAREIVRRRPLQTTSDLVDAVKAGMPTAARFGGGHPAKRTFQAIRIAVNGELDSLDDALPTAWAMLPTGGRLAAISFHSLEDRRVKRFLAERARGCVCPPELPVCVCGASRRRSC